MNLKWPSKDINNLMPWYIILWRIPFLFLSMLGLACAYYSLLLGFGKEHAKREVPYFI